MMNERLVLRMTELDQKLLDHFLNPRNVGAIENPDGFGRALNPVNQYVTDIYIRMRDGIFSDVKFKTFGCVVTIAAASALTSCVKGKSITEIIDNTSPLQNLLALLQQELGSVPDENWHCPPTAIQAFLIAIADFFQRNNDLVQGKKVEHILYEVTCFFEEGLREK
jgi:nitrogen fixation NifU-like protein